LVHILTQYQDAVSTPITIFFDGSTPARGPRPQAIKGQVEVLFSRAGQTADQMIERAAHLYQPYGEVLAVTDDHAERDTVIAMGGLASSCLNFVHSVTSTLTEVRGDIAEHNRRERTRFNRRK